MSGNSFTLHELSSPNPKSVFENASSGGAELNDLVALNSSGKTVAATDAASIRVIGVCCAEADDGKIQVVNGIFKLKNDATHAVPRSHIGKHCYVKNKATVDSNGGTNKVIAGLVVDVDSEGVFVDTTPNAMASQKAIAAAITDLTPASATASQIATAVNSILAALRSNGIIAS